MKTAIHNALTFLPQGVTRATVIINGGFIEKIIPNPVSVPHNISNTINGENLYLLPGAIDTHVHFRQPGMEHKATIQSESKAALAGGVTTFLDMPNTKPPTTGLATLEQKISIAAQTSYANYGFYIAATDENHEDINGFAGKAAGVKLFYGATTGNLLFNDPKKVKKLLQISRLPIAVHSESQQLLDFYAGKCKNLSGQPAIIRHYHCRPGDVCIQATQELLKLYENTQSHLHFLHITTGEEVRMLSRVKKQNPRLSFELCPHYLVFSTEQHYNLSQLLKVNPSIKTGHQRQQLLEALRQGLNDTIGTDHAPHLLEEKLQPYGNAPSGLPSIQHFLPVLFWLFEQNNLDFSLIPKLTAANPARIFNIKRRGEIKPGYKADLVLIQKQPPTDKILHRCGWSVYQDLGLNYSVFMTMVNGHIAYLNGQFTGRPPVENIAEPG